MIVGCSDESQSLSERMGTIEGKIYALDQPWAVWSKKSSNYPSRLMIKV